MKHLLNSQYQECSICYNIAASDSQAVCTLHHMLSKIESGVGGYYYRGQPFKEQLLEL